ncbi:uncharacterized protein M6B38_286935 [Iris pallida]|uniref:Transmembrane protein 33 n=1 Tax=Iris pallida TaxID=29817 RepID=A0AAX6HWK9_IRIPA|nr:uncharacterized protein M6B38_286935 [Iris pallida]
MGEENSGDPQQQTKRMAAAAYDYSSDPRWSEYWSNVLIPPHMASRSDVVDHYKRKFYQRFIDPDLVVEAMSTTSSSQSASASVRSSSPPATENTRPRTTTTASGTGTSTSAGTNSNSLRLDRRTIHFSVNAWILIVAVLGVLPLVSRNISNKAYRLSLLGTALSSFYSLYALYGKPRAWTIPAVQTWFQSVIATKDFIQLTYSLMLVSSQIHFKFALIPVLCRALDHVATFLRRNFTRSSFYRKYLEEPCLWVEANTTTLSILTSNAEIAMGFLLVISLLSRQRSILQTFMYWQLLKLMYHAPATAGYHQIVWAKIGRTTIPFIHRYAPFLNTPVSAVQRWWFSPTTSLPDGQQLVPASTRHGSSSSGSIGPFFAVMSVIIVLSALSCIFGRYCASWSQGPDARYDCLGWARRRCGGGGRCALGCCMGREVTSAVPVGLQPKVRESKQLPLSSPQAE